MLVDLDREELSILVDSITVNIVKRSYKADNVYYHIGLLKKLEYFLEEYTEIEND